LIADRLSTKVKAEGGKSVTRWALFGSGQINMRKADGRPSQLASD
jgi:hypothetical protein